MIATTSFRLCELDILPIRTLNGDQRCPQTPWMTQLTTLLTPTDAADGRDALAPPYELSGTPTRGKRMSTIGGGEASRAESRRAAPGERYRTCKQLYQIRGNAAQFRSPTVSKLEFDVSLSQRQAVSMNVSSANLAICKSLAGNRRAI